MCVSLPARKPSPRAQKLQARCLHCDECAVFATDFFQVYRGPGKGLHVSKTRQLRWQSLGQLSLSIHTVQEHRLELRFLPV